MPYYIIDSIYSGKRMDSCFSVEAHNPKTAIRKIFPGADTFTVFPNKSQLVTHVCREKGLNRQPLSNVAFRANSHKELL